MFFVIDHKTILLFVLSYDISFCFHSFVGYWFMDLTSETEMANLMYFHIFHMYHKTLKFRACRLMINQFFGKHFHRFMSKKTIEVKRENNIIYMEFSAF